MEHLLMAIINKKLMRYFFLSVLCCFCWGNAAIGQHAAEWGKWNSWGEQDDGTYRNPVIPSDYSDIDCIRVGDDYYAISSTFQFSPGMTLLHSADLVNWEICSNVVNDLTQISDALNWTQMNRYGRGIWAGTLRYHAGRFFVFFGTPDEGYFMTSASHPEGPWEPLTCLLPEKGWDDCTAIWDESGEGYFAGTHFADGYKTYLFKMSADGKAIDRKSAVLINEGNGREASKLIKAGDWYYLIFSEHKHGIGRYVMAKRTKKLTKPFKEEKQLALPCCEAMEPNQGGIVRGKDYKWYFLTHHGTGDWSGRVVSLLPVTWLDGWPVIGEVQADGVGVMAWSGDMPCINSHKPHIRRNDDFDEGRLAPQWQWNYQPRSDFFSLTERMGWLRLRAFCPLEPNRLMKAGNTLTQRTFRTQNSEVVVKMDLSHMKDGQKNGLCHFSARHSAIGIVKENGVCHLEYRKNDKISRGQSVGTKYIWFKSQWGLDGNSHYYYSLDGEIYFSFGEPYQLTWGNYRGDRIGIYCFNDNGPNGFVDVDYFHYRMD